MVTIDSLFQDHMILQRNKKITIWGTCEKGSRITVRFMGTETVASIEGQKWTAELPEMDAAREQTMEVCAETDGGMEVITVEDVAVGEVWIAGGQSNMEFWMQFDQDYEEIIKDCENPDLRMYTVPEACYPEQTADFDYSQVGFWRKATAENLRWFSAVSYRFARELQERLQVPVGVVVCAKGGSTNMSWISRKKLAEHGQVWLDDCDRELEQIDFEEYKAKMRKNPAMNWGSPFEDPINCQVLYGIDAEEQARLMREMPVPEGPVIHFDNRPACYYENMLLKIVPMAARGVIWYQGESDVFHSEVYEDIFQDMIMEWREVFGQKLPFYAVQLAPFQNWMDCSGTDFPVIRRAQMAAAQKTEGLYLASSSDSGMRYDIHPKAKQVIGKRLSLLALKEEYGLDLQAYAPKAVSCKTIDGSLEITFETDGESLEVKGDVIRELHLFGKFLDQEREVSFDTSDFAVRGKTLILNHANMGGARVRRVSFAQTDYYKVNLYGSNGLPTFPFELTVE